MRKNAKKLGSLLFPGAIGFLALSFQNCGSDIRPLSQSLTQQSLFEQETQLDKNRLPTLISSKNIQFWSKNSVTSISKTPLFADMGSIIIALGKSTQGTVFSLNSGTNIEEARILIKDGFVTLSHITDEKNFSILSVALPSIDYESYVIAASFGQSPSELSLLINGLPQAGELKKTGTPLNFSYLQKTLSFMDGAGNVKEIAYYYENLSAADLNVLSRYIATSSTVAGVVFDPSLIGDGSAGGSTSAGPSAQFQLAKNIIDGACLGCHNNSNNGDFRNLTQDQYIQKGLVVAKSPSTSKVYYRLSGAVGGGSNANMPKDAAALSADQIKAIADWINSI